MLKKSFFATAIVVLLNIDIAHSQCNGLINPANFKVNGSAGHLGNNEYKLTNNTEQQSGSIWFGNHLDLDADFTLEFEIYLGDADGGADGMTFVLQQSPQGTAATSIGGGLGYRGITPSMGVEFDTWKNPDNNDPDADHISINMNGKVKHDESQITSPFEVGNIEDNKYHKVKFTWTASVQLFKVFWDGNPNAKIEKTIEMKGLLFNNNSFVYWGWTGSTGNAKNLQKVKMISGNFKQELTISGTTKPSTCQPSGSITINVAGAVAPINYIWSNGATTQNITAVGAGAYTVTVVDACGNIGMQTFNVSGNQNSAVVIICPPNMTFDNTPSKCARDNVNYNLPVVKSNCPEYNLVQTEGLPSGSSFPMGTTVNTFMVTAPDGSTATCSFTVTVK
jgi:hypothetical protein